jgi:hypothetical protein
LPSDDSEEESARTPSGRKRRGKIASKAFRKRVERLVRVTHSGATGFEWVTCDGDVPRLAHVLVRDPSDDDSVRGKLGVCGAAAASLLPHETVYPDMLRARFVKRPRGAMVAMCPECLDTLASMGNTITDVRFGADLKPVHD